MVTREDISAPEHVLVPAVTVTSAFLFRRAGASGGTWDMSLPGHTGGPPVAVQPLPIAWHAYVSCVALRLGAGAACGAPPEIRQVRVRKPGQTQGPTTHPLTLAPQNFLTSPP